MEHQKDEANHEHSRTEWPDPGSNSKLGPTEQEERVLTAAPRDAGATKKDRDWQIHDESDQMKNT